MSEKCKECQLHHPMQSCLQALHLLSDSLEKKISSQKAQLSHYIENSKNIKKPPTPIDNYNSIIHPQIGCDGCFELPLTGTRFKCKTCPNFDLCFQCRYTEPHRHEDFFEITTANFHHGKSCSICFAEISDVIHKCKSCPVELCHECLVVNGHEHEDILDILPFDLKVEYYVNKKGLKCRNGEEIVVQFVLYNLSKQVVSSLIVEEENCPFVVVKREMNLNLYEKGIAVLEIGGVVRADARVYRTKFKFLETSIKEVIGPEVVLEFKVNSGLFSSIFRS